MRLAGYNPFEATTGIDQPFQLAVLLDNQPTKGPDWRPTTKNGPAPSDKPILVADAKKDSSESAKDTKDTEKSDSDEGKSASSQQAADSTEGMSPVVTGAIVAVVALFVVSAGVIVYRGKKGGGSKDA